MEHPGLAMWVASPVAMAAMGNDGNVLWLPISLQVDRRDHRPAKMASAHPGSSEESGSGDPEVEIGRQVDQWGQRPPAIVAACTRSSEESGSSDLEVEIGRQVDRLGQRPPIMAAARPHPAVGCLPH